jgi:hypothetical protein
MLNKLAWYTIHQNLLRRILEDWRLGPIHNGKLNSYFSWSILPLSKIFCFFTLCIQVEFEVKFGEVTSDIIIKTHCDF